jgi:hypothetical protein
MKPSYEQEKKYYAIRKVGTDLYVDNRHDTTRVVSCSPLGELTWICPNKRTTEEVLREFRNILPAKIRRMGDRHQKLVVVRVQITNRIEEI